MILKIKNADTGSKPIVVHAQGLTNPRLFDYFNKLLTIFLNTDPPPTTCTDLTVLTTTNHSSIGPLQKSINHLRLPANQWLLIGADIADFQLCNKLAIINAILPNITTKYLLFADSHDVIVTNIDKIITRFLDFNCQMLFNSEPFFWPGPHEYNRPEANNPKPIIEPQVFSQQFEDNAGNGYINRYLNSGVWIANTDFVRWLLPQYLNSPLSLLKFWHGGRLQGQDQTHYRDAFQRHSPLIKLDYESKLFQTMKESELVGGSSEACQRFRLSCLEYTISNDCVV